MHPQPAGPPPKVTQRPLSPASAQSESVVHMKPGPPLLPPKVQVPAGGVVEHCASFGRWFTGTRPPLELPPELLEEPPLPLPLLLDTPLEDVDPPPEELEPPLELLPPELDELPPSAPVPASLLVPKTVPPQAQSEATASTKASSRRMTDPPMVGSFSNCGARLLPVFSRGRARHIVPRSATGDTRRLRPDVKGLAADFDLSHVT